MNKTESLDRLFEKWRMKYANEEFAEDGIVNEHLWKTAKTKILFLLKETNDYSKDFRVLVNNKPWSVIGYWAYGLQNITSSTIAPFSEARKDSNWKCSCRSSALMNIKKSPGVSAADMDVIQKAAESDHEFILEEIDIIQPDIIVCCGTLNVCRLFLPFDSFKSKGPDERCYYYQDAIWIDYCHPSARFYRHDMMYYTLMVLYQNCLKD